VCIETVFALMENRLEAATAPSSGVSDSHSGINSTSKVMDSSNRLNLTQPIALFKEDILLSKTSQEVFGRKIGTPKTKKTSLETLSVRELNRKPPITTPSQSSSLNTATGKRLQQRVDRTLPSQSFLNQFADDMKDTREVERALQQNLRLLSSQKRKLERSYDKDSKYLVMILQMPNVIRTLFMASELLNRSRRLNGFRRWNLIIARMKFVEAQRLRRQRRILNRTEQLWLRSVARHQIFQRREQVIAEQQLRFDSSVRIIQRLFLFHHRNQELCRQSLLKREQERRFKYQTEEIQKIQRVYRGWRGRCLYRDKWRLLLLLEMRQWSNGNIQKLLDRSSTTSSPSLLLLLS
jgi:hypothetical protein